MVKVTAYTIGHGICWQNLSMVLCLCIKLEVRKGHTQNQEIQIIFWLWSKLFPG